MNIKKSLVPGAVGLAAFAGVAGGSTLNNLMASADTATTATASSTSATSSTTQPQRDESKGGHTANGKTETLLTGDTATKAKAAADAAVSGGTVLRVETDAEGATYEAHVQKSDGTQVTVKMDANFKVTGTETGHGGPGDSAANSSSTN
jgi:uncharacterized membrane protein YkoI